VSRFDDPIDLVHTGPGTLAGRYLRTFWQPVYRAEDLPSGTAAPIRIMSEDFTLYRGESGTPHLSASRCAHRGTQLSSGWVEGDSIRCRYHGWKYDGEGQCVEQPGESSDVQEFKGSNVQGLGVKIRSYPVKEYLGIIFAYLGEGEPPPFRRHPDFEREGVVEAGLPEYWPCNYFNRLDNACDSAHVAFTHRESGRRTGRTERLGIRKVWAEETDYGIRRAFQLPGAAAAYHHFHMPNINQTRSALRVEGSLADAATLMVDRIFWRLPVDDERCVSFVVDLVPLTGEAAEAYRRRRNEARESVAVSPNEVARTVLEGRMSLEDVPAEMPIYYLFWIEDYVVQVGQGILAPRAEDRLGRMDQGVLLLRKIWERELKALAAGRPLKSWRASGSLMET
jgi:5,5'-dehydrodivanillate O-demethylase